MEPPERSTPSAAIIGVGAIGSVIAARLDASGTELRLATRQRRRAQLCVDGPSPGASHRVEARWLDDPSELAECDWAWLCVKAHQVDGTEPWLRRIAQLGLNLVVVQNGVEHLERVSSWLAADAVLPVIIDCPATRDANGVTRLRREPRLTVPSGALGAKFSADVGGALSIECSEDFLTAAWTKLCRNVPGGAIAALTGQPVNVVRDPAVAHVARELTRECIAVGRAHGAQLEDALVDEILENMSGAPDTAITSMLADRVAGRVLEVDARNGAVVRLGKRVGVSTPVNGWARALLSAVNRA